MNLPEYMRAINMAVERFEHTVMEAKDELLKALTDVRVAFFEDESRAEEDKPLRNRARDDR